MADSRRGFISTAAGVGVFAIGVGTAARAAGPIGDNDVLVALPGERYFAIPPSSLEQFAVNPQAFAAEENRRANGGASAKYTSSAADGSPPPPPPPRPRSTTVAMGIRG